jgi:uncharacterized protein (DUF1499 family)
MPALLSLAVLFKRKKMSFKTLAVIGLIIMSSSSFADGKKLPLCPNTPNCVSSQAATEDSHFIAPFKIIADTKQVWAGLKQALLNQPRTIITAETADTIDAEATSLVFRFVDDLKIILDSDNNIIHIRSASRVGYSDFGVNRKRMEQLRTTLQQARLIE